MAFNLMQGAAAGAGADALEEVLKRKLLEQAQAAQQEQFARKLAEDARQADMSNAIATRGADQGDKRIGLQGRELDQQGQQFGQRLGLDKEKHGEDVRQFEALAPTRVAGVRRSDAETAELQRRPAAEQLSRDFTTGRDKTLHGYNLGEIGAQGQNALRIANVRQQPDPAATAAASAAATAQQNEVQDTADLIDEIVRDPSRARTTGPLQAAANSGWAGYVGRIGDPSGVARVESKHDQLIAKLALANAGKLKGQGNVTEMERKLLRDAVTSLRLGLGDEDYVTAANKARGALERIGAKPRGGATGDSSDPEYDAYLARQKKGGR